MTVAEIADEAVLSVATTKAALDELCSIQYLRVGLDGCYEIERFQEKTTSNTGAAERKRRQRRRDQGVTVTLYGHATEEEVEVDIESGTAARPARPACDCLVNPFLGRGVLSAEEIVDMHFIATFARAKAPSAVDKARPKWLGWVRLMVDAGYHADEIWAACATTHTDARHSLIVQSGGIWASLKRIRPELARPAAPGNAVVTIPKANRK